MYCGCKARAIDIGWRKYEEGTLGISSLQNGVIMVDTVPLECWFEGAAATKGGKGLGTG